LTTKSKCHNFTNTSVPQQAYNSNAAQFQTDKNARPKYIKLTD